MLILGDVLAIVALLVGVCLSAWATILATTLACSERAHFAQETLERSPRKALFMGLAFLLPLLLLGIAMVTQPFPLVVLSGYSLMLAVTAVAFIGVGGAALSLARRIRQLDPSQSAFSSLVKGSTLLVVACLLPMVGWFLIAPALLSLGFGSGVQSLWARSRASSDAVAQ